MGFSGENGRNAYTSDMESRKEVVPRDRILEGRQVAGFDFSAWSGLSAVQNASAR